MPAGLPLITLLITAGSEKCQQAVEFGNRLAAKIDQNLVGVSLSKGLCPCQTKPWFSALKLIDQAL